MSGGASSDDSWDSESSSLEFFFFLTIFLTSFEGYYCEAAVTGLFCTN